MNLLITKTPILILSTPRTGSTVLGAYIKSLLRTDIPFFSEPDYAGQEEIDRFRNYTNQSKDFILKCHFIFLHRYGSDVADYLLDKAYKIRIRRKDFVKQVASLYIAQARNNRWHYDADQLNLIDPVPIDLIKIKKNIAFLKNANYELDQAPVQFDLDLYYEDLPLIDNTSYYITPKPANYNVLITMIKALL